MAFMTFNRRQNLLFPPSYEELLPDNHLAKFVVNIVDELDLSRINASYAGHGKEAYPPLLLLPLLIYSYCTGIFSSRAIERETYNSLPHYYICAGLHPDHSTISDFRRRFAPEVTSLFTQVLEIAKDYGSLQLGSVYLDGTKIKANASKHHAFSYLRAKEIKAQLENEVKELMRMAEEADSSSSLIEIPKEIELRENKIEVLRKAIKEIVQMAKARYACETAAYEAKVEARERKFQETGKKPGGQEPSPPKEGPNDKDQTNLTDSESRIMPNSDKGFTQAYNAQACVEPKNMLIVEAHLTQNPNDKKEMEPALERLEKLPESLGKVDIMSADAGYYSDQNVKACEDKGIDPYIAAGRVPHHQSLSERLTPEPSEIPEDATTIDKMRHKLRTLQGKAVYKLRKQVVEPVFGVIKSVMGFRQFSRRGFANCESEWIFCSTCYNLKKIHSLS
ncbi:MAG: IS1182 family transposase [Deltaproteobacteria bacterium]|jgi:transposase|nr:IS1182 family transposase [Deltaproteobacteria bacterium]